MKEFFIKIIGKIDWTKFFLVSKRFWFLAVPWVVQHGIAWLVSWGWLPAEAQEAITNTIAGKLLTAIQAFGVWMALRGGPRVVAGFSRADVQTVVTPTAAGETSKK